MKIFLMLFVSVFLSLNAFAQMPRLAIIDSDVKSKSVPGVVNYVYVDTLKSGDSIIVYAKKGTYYKIFSENGYGYVNEVFLKKDQNLKLIEEDYQKRELDSLSLELEGLERLADAEIIKRFGKILGGRVINKEVFIGMTTLMATLSQGEPDNKKTNVSEDGKTERWFYNEKNLTLFFFNEKLKSFQY